MVTLEIIATHHRTIKIRRHISNHITAMEIPDLNVVVFSPRASDDPQRFWFYVQPFATDMRANNSSNVVCCILPTVPPLKEIMNTNKSRPNRTNERSTEMRRINLFFIYFKIIYPRYKFTLNTVLQLALQATTYYLQNEKVIYYKIYDKKSGIWLNQICIKLQLYTSI